MKSSKSFRQWSNSAPVVRPLKWWAAKIYFDRFLKAFVKNDEKHELRVLGLRRTGNHAILQWIFSLLPGDVFFCNDAVPELALSKAPIRKYIRSIGSSKFLIHSYEDKDPSRVFTDQDFDRTGNSISSTDIVLIRDPYNLFASRWVWKDPQGEEFRENIAYREHVISLWKACAKWYIASVKGEKDCTGINYNKWFSNASYRDEIKRSLNLKNEQGELDAIGEFGGGSSFDGQASDGKASASGVLLRWQSLRDVEDFKKIFRDEELINLADAIFDPIPGIKEWLA